MADHGFTKADFAHVASMLRNTDDKVVRATLSNWCNAIIAALDIAASQDVTHEALNDAANRFEGLSYIHDGNPSDAMADTPPLEYARHMLWEAPDMLSIIKDWLLVGNDMAARKAIRERARAAISKAEGQP